MRVSPSPKVMRSAGILVLKRVAPLIPLVYCKTQRLYTLTTIFVRTYPLLCFLKIIIITIKYYTITYFIILFLNYNIIVI